MVVDKKTDVVGVDILEQIENLGKDEGGRKACFIIIAGSNLGQMFSLEQEELLVGRGDEVTIKVQDDGVSRQHAKIKKIGENRFVIQDLNSTNGTYCNGERIAEKLLDDGDKVLIGTTTIMKFSYQDDLEASFQEHIYESAVRDALTNSFNKKSFDEQLDVEYAYAKRHNYYLSLAIFDIDHFKQVNDTYGHLAGDFVLKDMSRTVNRLLRKEDFFARIGGEEFAIIMRELDQERAKVVTERILHNISEHIFEFEDAGIIMVIPVTISIGVATFKDGKPATPNDLQAKADEMLYRAKEAGRNQVVLG